MKTFLILVTLFLAACGASSPLSSPSDASSSPATATATATAADGLSPSSCGHMVACIIRGAVMGGFALSVDGKQYDDVEAFYSYELTALKKQADALGYQDVDFSAQLGLSDFQNNMTAYVENSAGHGYAGTTTVFNGQFQFSDVDFSDTPDSHFKVRVSKRLTLNTAQASFCWNLFGEADNVAVNSGVILDTYTTSFTLYQCSDNSTNAMSLPAPPKS